MKSIVYEILTCLLHVPRTNIFSINPSVLGAKQPAARRVQFCLSLPPKMRLLISVVLTHCLGIRCRRILIKYFPGMPYGQENIENLVKAK
jgi:hypothetical protein